MQKITKAELRARYIKRCLRGKKPELWNIKQYALQHWNLGTTDLIAIFNIINGFDRIELVESKPKQRRRIV